ncbi:KTSC domain-containing protein [Sinomonas atrocyanea]|uniref:KTSC domain-containing protein n=1 Tax=Sinomonas atrocyanea TaxID=37927 RepID=UPI00286B4E3D|nr:KTSC domain-containing protein [Sinomonas atrocyanea]
MVGCVPLRGRDFVDMTPVASTNVQSVGYDRLTQTMRVQFHGGGVYDYYGIPLELFESMLLPNPWRRLGRTVRRHPYRPVR